MKSEIHLHKNQHIWFILGYFNGNLRAIYLSPKSKDIRYIKVYKPFPARKKQNKIIKF